MDVKDVMIKMCDNMMDIEKQCRRLGKAYKEATRRQNGLNRRFFVAILGCAIVIGCTEKRRQEMQNEIDILKNKLEELTTAKEE